MQSISKWIWTEAISQNDSYAEFYDTFKFTGQSMELLISADSNYSVYINGAFVNSGQYPDFPHYKVYDKLDITELCVKGENSLAVVVWYYGKENMSYFPGKAALRYELYSGGELICFSNEHTLSRMSVSYKNGAQKYITSQLGFSFFYDCTKEDNWRTGKLNGFSDSVIVSQELPMFERPVKKLIISDRCDTDLLKNESNKHFLYDIGHEEVGYFTVRLKSSAKQKITVCYGEHIVDGGVRRLIGARDFSFDIIVGEGVSEYTNYFRRLGLRYLEVFAENEIEIEYISVCPCFYPLNKVQKTFGDTLTDDIYNVSVRTLELCMHDHYEDCPWREQGLYAMDSRNQMLCGYYAFKEYEFPRANLYLMSKDERPDGLLSICTPSGNDLTIPSFSLHYFIEVYEYTVYSKDLSLAKEILPKLKSVLNVFLSRMESGLVPNFTSSCHWNFYEWSDDLSGRLGKNDSADFDAALNCLLSIALDRMSRICSLLGEDCDLHGVLQSLNNKIFEFFYDPDKKLFKNKKDGDKYSELVNSLALLCGAVKGDAADRIAEIMTSENNLTKATLSMVCFKYDALIKINRKKYKGYILDDIRVKYKRMLDAGATSFWETEKGDSDFHNAGSLCHGWSSMPVYYFNILE